jgi:hypothetical protein
METGDVGTSVGIIDSLISLVERSKGIGYHRGARGRRESSSGDCARRRNKINVGEVRYQQ